MSGADRGSRRILRVDLSSESGARYVPPPATARAAMPTHGLSPATPFLHSHSGHANSSNRLLGGGAGTPRKGSSAGVISAVRRRGMSYAGPGQKVRHCAYSGCDQPLALRGYCAYHAEKFAAGTAQENPIQKMKLQSFPDFMPEQTPADLQQKSKSRDPSLAREASQGRVSKGVVKSDSGDISDISAMDLKLSVSAGTSTAAVPDHLPFLPPTNMTATERRRKSIILEKEMEDKHQTMQQLQRELTTLRWKHAALVGANQSKATRDRLLTGALGMGAPAKSPIEVAIQSILQIISNFSENQEYQIQLMDVIKSLSSPAIYQPITERLSEDPNLSSTTRDWITSTFTPSPDQKKQGDETKKDHPERKESKSDSQPTDIMWELKSWRFNVWDHTYDQLLSFLMKMIAEFDLFEKCGVDPVEMENFLLSIRSSYRNNSYHNFVHCVDVTQTCFFFLCNTSLIETLQMSALETFCLLVGSICHDVDHPGLNNTFQMNSRTPLALRYNDVSVLENHHSSKLFMTMSEEGCDICSKMSPEDGRLFRKLTIQLVLSTDMTKHFELISRFKTRVETSSFSPGNPEDKTLLMSLMLHAADISNPAKPFPLADIWATKVLEEFHTQGDLELATGLPVSPMCSREDCDKPKQQLDFIDYVVKPLFEAVSSVISFGMAEPLQCIQDNRKQWEVRLNKVKEIPLTATQGSSGSATEQTETDKVNASVSKMVGVLQLSPTRETTRSPRM